MSDVVTSIENPDGETLWAPNDFGTYSIEKIEVISKILQNMLKELVVTVKVDQSGDDNTFYTKEESNEYFLRKTDYRSLALDTINDLVQSNVDNDVIVSVNSFNQMINAVNFLSRICFDLTYEQLKVSGEELTFVPFHTEINNLSARVSSFDTNMDRLLYTVYQTNANNSIDYTKVNFVRLSDLEGYVTTSAISDIRTSQADLIDRVRIVESGKQDKATTLSGYGITDSYTKTEADNKFAEKSTTLSGYGITNAYTKTESNNRFADKSTTLSGYGITDAYTKSEVNSVIDSSGVTVGTVSTYAGSTVPSGYLPCDGSDVSRETYSDLFSVIGTLHGSGNGSTTFNVPNIPPLATNVIYMIKV